MIKTKLILVFLLFSLVGLGQTDAEDSIRWIRVMKSKDNSKLFEFDGMNDSTLFGATWKNAYYGDPVFYVESTDIAEKTPYYPQLFKFPQVDSLYIDSCITNVWSFTSDIRANSIVLAFDHNHPFLDALGDAIIVDCQGNGSMCMVYPAKSYYAIRINEIKEIRIKELRTYNKTKEEFDYIPIAIQLTPQIVNNTKTEVWLDLNKLVQKSPQIKETDWYKHIVKKKYIGKQFMQL